MKKRITRWLALLMAVAMLITSAVYTSGIATVPESALKAAEEQLAEEGKLEGTTGEAEIEAPQPDVPEEPEPEVPEQVVEIPAEQPAEQPVEAPQEVPEEVRYALTLHKPDIDGGTIQSWTTGEKADSTNGYTEEVLENTVYNMEVTAADKYEVEKVTDQYQNIIQPKSVEGKVYLYEIPVTENMELRVTYKEITVVSEEVGAADTAQKDEAKGTEDNKADSKAADEAKADAEKTDGAKTDSEKSDGAKADSEKTDGAKTDSEKTDGAKTDFEKSDDAKADSKKTDEAKADSKTADESKDSSKKTEEPADESKKADSSKEDKDKTAEEKEESEKMPEMTFEEMAGDIIVVVNAPEGAFPEGTVMKVKTVSDEAAKTYAEKIAGEGKEVTSAKAVDITFYNKKGEEIQPEVPVKVQLLNTGVEGEEKGVFRKNADDSVEKIVSGGETSSGTAFEAEHFTVYGDYAVESASEDSEEGYVAKTDGFGMTDIHLYGTALGDSIPAYCYNEGAAYPEGDSVKDRYKEPVEYNGQGETKASVEVIRALIYAGYPFDGLGLRKQYNMTDDAAAHTFTQMVLWAILEGRSEDTLKESAYMLALYKAAQTGTMPQPGTLTVSSGTISFVETEVSTEAGNKWVFKTSDISLAGYDGEYKLQLPEGVKAYDSTGNERDTFTTLESFHLECESQEAIEKLTESGKLSITASYTYQHPEGIYYAEWLEVKNVVARQNLLCYTTKIDTVSATFTADVEYAPRGGYHIYYILNGNRVSIVKETEVQAENPADFKGIFEADKANYTANEQIKEYCGKNNLDYTKFIWDQSPAYVNGGKAIYLNFDTSEKVTVTFESHGGTADFEKTKVLPYGGNLLRNETDSRIPVKAGYDFAGWYTQENGGEKIAYLNCVVEDITLHAQYMPAQYNLTVKIDGNLKEEYTQTKGYHESFIGENNVYKVDDGYYIANVRITGGSDNTEKVYTSSDSELGEYANKFTLPSIDKVTDKIEGSCLVEITTKQLKSMTVSAENVDKRYDGNAYGITAKINGTVPAGAIIRYYNTKTQKYDLEESPVYQDVKLNQKGTAASYTVKFQATAPGYKAAEGSATVIIRPIPLTVTADNKEKDYGADDPELTYKANKEETELVKGEKAGYTGSLKRAEGEAVGDYNINQNTLKLQDNGTFKANNYKLKFVKGKLTIKGKLVLKTKDYIGKYDGAYHDLPKATVEASEASVNPVIEYSRDEEVWSSEIPSRKDVTVNEDEGKEIIYVRAYVKDSKYYEPVTATAAFNITQATLTVTADSKLGLPYGTPIGTLTGKIEGFLGDDGEADTIVGNPVYTTDATDTSDAVDEGYTIYTDVSGLKSKNNNYLFEPVNGKITIIPLADVLQISAAGNESVYDSEKHTLKSFIVTGIGGNELASWNGEELTTTDANTKLQYKVKDSEEWLDTLPEFVDAGTYQVTVKAENKNYKESVQADAEVLVSQRPVEIQVDSSQKNFKEPDPEPDPEFTGKVIDKGEGTGFTAHDEDIIGISYSRTNHTEHKAGKYEKVLTAEINWGEVKESNYKVTILPGNFEIIPSGELNFVPDTVQQIYNGESLAASASANIEGAKIEYSLDGNVWKDTIDQKDVLVSADNTYYVHVRVSKEGYETKQSDPNKKETMAQIIINPAVIKVTAPDQTIAFEDRESLELSYTNTGAVKEETPGFKGNLTLDREIESIGEYSIQLNNLELSDNAATGFKESNYKLSSELGIVTVTGTLTLTAKNYEGLYDGQAHSAEISDLRSSDNTPVGAMYSLDGVRWQEEEITYKDVPDNITNTYTYYVKPYAEGYSDGESVQVTVTIHPAVVAVTPASFEVAFTDEDKADKLNNLKYDAEIQDDKGDAYDTGETPQFSGNLQKEYGDRVGSYPIIQGTLALKDSVDKTFKASNYILKVGEGNARITGELHLDLTAYIGDYDGRRHTIETAASADDGREELLVQFSKNGTNWSTEEVFRKNVTADGPVTVYVRVQAKNNANYEPVRDSANIVISKVPLIIKADDVDDVIYGTEIPALSGSYVSGLVGKDTLEDALTNANGLADGSYTTEARAGSNAGSYEIIAAQGGLTSHNYELLFRPGTLNIIQASNLNVTAEGKDVIYDANEHTLTVQYTGGESTTVEYSTNGGETWQSELPKYTEVGEYPALVRAENPNYSNTPTAEATVIIRPKDVTIQVADATKVYGTNDPVFTGMVSGLVKDDDLGTIVYSRDTADLDKEEVGDDITLTAAYENNKNYHIIVILGKLEITPVGTLNVTVTDTEVVYDGSEYGVVVSQTPDSTPLYSTDGENWSEIPPVFTEVGEYEVYVKVVQDGYEDSEVVTGKVTILPRDIVITAASAEKTYDGTELVSTSAFLTSGSLAEGEAITSITVRGSQTEVGSSPNVASNVVISNGEKNVTGNYNAEYADGTLTVRAAQASIAPPVITITPPATPTTPVTPITPPTTPTTPVTPITPPAPGTPVTVAAGTPATPLVSEPAPDVNVLIEAEGTDRGYDLTEVADTEVPLANRNLDDHACCILHFLLMLAVLLVTILYTRSMKKRQARFFELQEEYELELIRRDLEKYEDDTETEEIA